MADIGMYKKQPTWFYTHQSASTLNSPAGINVMVDEGQLEHSDQSAAIQPHT